MTKYHFFAIVLAFAVLAGCGGGGFVPAGGKITFDDGSPVTMGGIVFATGTFMAEGQIQPDGRYTLSSLKPGDGLPPGTYTVTISSEGRDANEQPIYYVDPKFANPATSQLSVEVVKGGKNQFDFTVTKPK